MNILTALIGIGTILEVLLLVLLVIADTNKSLKRKKISDDIKKIKEQIISK